MAAFCEDDILAHVQSSLNVQYIMLYSVQKKTNILPVIVIYVLATAATWTVLSLVAFSYNILTHTHYITFEVKF
jgi:hypothetical protein